MRLRAAARVVVTLALLAAPVAAAAQAAGKVPTVGVIAGGFAKTARPGNDAFERGLRDLGWVPGQTVRIEYRYAEGRPERASELAAELVRLRADVIVARSAIAAQDAKRVSTTVPLVMAGVGFDPIRTGLVASLAKPGGNVTGLALSVRELAKRQLELLKEVVSGLTHVGVLGSAAPPMTPPQREELRGIARGLGLAVQLAEAGGRENLGPAFDGFQSARAGAVIVLADPHVLERHREQIVALALKHRLPALYSRRSYVAAGGLMSYGTDPVAVQRRAATYVDRILKGAKPADLPVEQPTQFELIVNTRAAKGIGLTIPQSVLARADEVIR